MNGFVFKGKYKYKMKFKIEASDYIDIEVEGDDLTIDQAKEIGESQLKDYIERKRYPNCKILACVDIVGEKTK